MKEIGSFPDLASALAEVQASEFEAKGSALLGTKTRNQDSTSNINICTIIGDASDILYLTKTNCDLKIIGEEFGKKPYALAVQQGSVLKDRFNDA